MPAESKQQQKAAGMALSAKRGETSPSELKGAAREMYESMSEAQLEDFASTKRKGLPRKKEEPAGKKRGGKKQGGKKQDGKKQGGKKKGGSSGRKRKGS